MGAPRSRRHTIAACGSAIGATTSHGLPDAERNRRDRSSPDPDKSQGALRNKALLSNMEDSLRSGGVQVLVWRSRRPGGYPLLSDLWSTTTWRLPRRPRPVDRTPVRHHAVLRDM